jgi:3-oxoacyl-[acyl-carrier-protein] synthase-1
VALPGRLSAAEEPAQPPSGLRPQVPSLPAAVRDMLQVGLRSAGFEIEAGRVDVHAGEHAAFGAALQEGVRRLRAREAECCVVGAADTLLDSDVLQALMDAGRLKTPNEPLGLAPGEGGAFYLLERGEAARRRGAPILGVITGVATGVDEDRLAERAPSGRALAGLAASITGTSDLARPPLLVTDYNGEERRSAEYGHTLFQLGALNPAFQDARTWFPAASFGDTGAASAAIGLGMVLRGFARGYAGASEALVMSSSPAEARSVVGVRAAA